MEGRFAADEHKAQQQHQQMLRGGIGLSFSGGGFRATAISHGTLTLLQDLGGPGQGDVECFGRISGPGNLFVLQGRIRCAKEGQF